MLPDLSHIQDEVNNPDLSILEELGDGGFGAVYRAYDHQLKRELALKILHAWRQYDDADDQKRFVQEAKVLSAMKHRNLLMVYGLGFTKNARPFIQSELLRGEPLSVYIEKNAPLTVKEALGLSMQICQAMAYAESFRVVHRDLKPENIFLCPEGDDLIVKVLDFGLCRDMSRNPDTREFKTLTGQILGSPSFMSPEQCMGRPADQRSDIYAFACILYEMLSGKRLFGGQNPAEIILKQVKEFPGSIIENEFKKAGLPESLSKLLLECLSKSPDKRPQSFNDLIGRLELLLSLNSSAKYDSKLFAKEKDIAKGIWLEKRRLFFLLPSFLLAALTGCTLLFLLNTGFRLSALESFQTLDLSYQWALMKSAVNPLFSCGFEQAGEDTCLAFVSAGRLRSLPAPCRCIVESSLLKQYRSKLSERGLELLSMYLYQDILDLHPTEHPQKPTKQTNLLVHLPAGILYDSLSSGPHSQAFWRKILTVRPDLSTYVRNSVRGRSIKLTELQTLAVKSLKGKTAEDYEKYLQLMTEQAEYYRLAYLYPGIRSYDSAETSIKKMKDRSKDLLVLIAELEAKASSRLQPRKLQRAKTQALLYMAFANSLLGEAKEASRYLELAKENDRLSGGFKLLLSYGPTTQLSWDELVRDIEKGPAK